VIDWRATAATRNAHIFVKRLRRDSNGRKSTKAAANAKGDLVKPGRVGILFVAMLSVVTVTVEDALPPAARVTVVGLMAALA